MNAFLKNNLRGILLGILSTLLVGLGIAYGVIASGVINPCADEPIPPLERWAAKTSLRAYLKTNTPKTENPLKASSSEDLKAGAKLYINNCVPSVMVTLTEVHRKLQMDFIGDLLLSPRKIGLKMLMGWFIGSSTMASN